MNSGDALMVKNRRYHPLVADDLSAATTYYDAISIDLGNRFRATVRSRLGDISLRAESFACIHGEMRAAMVDRFPYVLLFEDRGDSVAILGVFHAGSDQTGWFERSL